MAAPVFSEEQKQEWMAGEAILPYAAIQLSPTLHYCQAEWDGLLIEKGDPEYDGICMCHEKEF